MHIAGLYSEKYCQRGSFALCYTGFDASSGYGEFSTRAMAIVRRFTMFRLNAKIIYN